MFTGRVCVDMAENIAFSDWSEKLDSAGTNHWLPAYGLQQPPVAVVGNGHQQNDTTFDSGPHDHTDYFEDNNGNYNALLCNIIIYVLYKTCTHVFIYLYNIIHNTHTHTYTPRRV